jgi:hypothetical protein
MKLLQRLKYYGIGFGIGLVMVFVFFGGRGCSWTPENRVKADLNNHVIVISQEDLDWIKQQGLTPKDYLKLLDNGDINFGESVKRENPKFYLFTGETENEKSITAQYELRDHDAYVSLLRPLTKEKITDKKMPEFGHIIQLPADSNIIVFNDLAKCQANYLNITPKQVIDALRKNGEVNYSLTNLKEVIKPVYCFEFSINKKSYAGLAKWYKDKILFTRFRDADSVDCH